MQPKTYLFTSDSQHPPKFGHAVYLGASSTFVPMQQTELTPCQLGNFDCFCCLLIFTFKKSLFFFKNTLSGIPSECKTIWIQIRPDVSSGLIWIQTVCKVYQQTTLVDKGLNSFACLTINLTNQSTNISLN